MILVGGVGELYQGDLDLGRHAVERLAGEGFGSHVTVEDLYYGAIAVTQHLEDVRPSALVVVGAAERGRPPGTVERRRIGSVELDTARFRAAVEQAGAGTVSIDLLLEVASGFGALPSRTVAVEVEPARRDPSEELSEAARAGLDEAMRVVRTEVSRIPLLELADRVRALLAEGRIERTPALDAVERLVSELDVLDREGRWGAAFSAKDELRMRIASGQTGEGMTHLDWSQWWALVEETDRLQHLEITAA